MIAYNKFANSYDYLMRDAPYERALELIEETIDKYLKNNTKQRIKLADLGCGTGSLAIALAQRGHQVVGIDLSEQMLAVAEEKQIQDKLAPARRASFLCQDIINLELPFQANLIISMFDSLNYILDIDDLYSVFCKMYEQVTDNGIIIFDLLSSYKMTEVIAGNSHFDVSDDIISIWQNSYSRENKILSYDLSILVKENDNLYRRFDEYHEQRSYSIGEIFKIIIDSGFTILEEFSDYDSSKTIEGAEDRYFWILKK